MPALKMQKWQWMTLIGLGMGLVVLLGAGVLLCRITSINQPTLPEEMPPEEAVTIEETEVTKPEPEPEPEPEPATIPEAEPEVIAPEVPKNCTLGLGNLMLINPNFTVDAEFIANRRQGLVSVSERYGISEYNYAVNGDNLLMPEAAAQLQQLVQAYAQVYPGHQLGTRSCFRTRGTNCGRLCAATGASDHHTGLTCDLIDTAYGTALDTADYARHIEWQWLRAHSYEYGFIDRFPAAWAGGSMSEPLNVDVNGSTGLYETWHYRYVGVAAATEIATGKYNQGAYDSLEHYLLVTGRVSDLKQGVCTP